jgi:hypothetical protein
MEPCESDLTSKLSSMKKATVSCVKDLLMDARDFALEGNLDQLLRLADYIIATIKTIGEDVEELLSKEGSNLWEEGEKESLTSFGMVVKRCLASWVLMAIQLKMVQHAPGEA